MKQNIFTTKKKKNAKGCLTMAKININNSRINTNLIANNSEN